MYSMAGLGCQTLGVILSQEQYEEPEHNVVNPTIKTLTREADTRCLFNALEVQASPCKEESLQRIT